MHHIAAFEFTGTAKDFEDKMVKLNGQALDKITVANLAKHKLLEYAGEGDKPARGRTPKKFRAVSLPGMVFSF